MAVSTGSRGGLIVTMVMFVVIALVASIFAIYFGVQYDKVNKELTAEKSKYMPEFVKPNEIASSMASALKEARKEDPAMGQASLLTVAVTQRDNLVKVVDPSATSGAGAMASARDALAAAQTQVGDVQLPSPSSDLAGAIKTLASGLKAKQNEVATLKQQLETINKDITTKIAEHQEVLKQRDAQIAEIRQQADRAIESVRNDRAQSQGVLQEIEKNRTDDRDRLASEIATREQQIKALSNDSERLKYELAQTRAKFEGMRLDVNEPTVRRADGLVQRVVDSRVCYINLGHGDQITPGLTFEVFDRTQGIPEFDTEVPEGKASIEVVSVGQNASECRIVRSQLGTTLIQGDLLMNLVYDKNTTFNFMVYGRFDLDQNGVATAADTEVIRRLVDQFGGKNVDKVSVDTDFLVLGKEPELPIFTSEELLDPVNAQRLADASADLDNYLELVNQAAELRIPVLNQNRFLYFVGYYSQATR